MRKNNYHIPLFLGAFMLALTAFFLYKNSGFNRLSDFENPDEPIPETRDSAQNYHPEQGYLLPDLQSERLDNAYIVSDPDGNRTLRFPGTFSNTGDGPLELVGTTDEESGTTRAVQIIYKDGGSKEEKLAGLFVLHPEHEHWHFENFIEFEILTLDEEGDPDRKLAGTGKMTFCIQDYSPLTEEIPAKPDRIVYPQCASDIQGISVGWQDTYLADVPGQEIDITMIPDGQYVFRSTVDPENRIIEKDENNNSAATYIEIIGNEAIILPGPPS